MNELAPDTRLADHSTCVRTANALHKLGFDVKTVTLAEVAKVNVYDFRRQSYVGAKTVRTLRALLARAGLDLAGVDPPGQVPDEWTVETISLMHGQATVTLGCNGDRLKVRRTLDDARALHVGMRVRVRLEAVSP